MISCKIPKPTRRSAAGAAPPFRCPPVASPERPASKSDGSGEFENAIWGERNRRGDAFPTPKSPRDDVENNHSHQNVPPGWRVDAG